MSDDAHGVTQAWVTFATNLTFEQLPSASVKSAKMLILDTVGVAIAASTMGECCDRVLRMTLCSAADTHAPVLGLRARKQVASAAFANGALSHALNFDALSNSGAHLGLAAVPLPVSLIERKTPVSGKELIVAVAVAAELVCSLSFAASADDNSESSFLTGQVLAYFGATLAGGRVLGLEPSKLFSALALCLMQVSGSRQPSFEGVPGKAIYGAFPNHSAMLSLHLADLGVDAGCESIAGQYGLLRSYFGSQRYPRPPMAGPHAHFLSEQIAIKRWPVSSVVSAFVEVFLRLTQVHNIAPDSICKLRVRAGSRAARWVEPEHIRRRPTNAAAAANSIFFGLAKAWFQGTITLDDLTSDGLSEAKASMMMELIEFKHETATDGSLGVLEIVLHDTSSIEERVFERSSSVDWEFVAEKFCDCARYSRDHVDSATAEEVAGRLVSLEQETDAGFITRLLYPPA